MAHELRIIKSQDDCSEFLGWLEEHTDVSSIQGWTLQRFTEWGSNRIAGFQYGSTPSQSHYVSAKWMYSERRALNDWIRTEIICKR
jgi:hypothetical protein